MKRDFIVISVLILFVLLGFVILNPLWSSFESLEDALLQFAEPSKLIVGFVVIALCLDVLIPVPSTVTLFLLGVWLGPFWGGLVGFMALMISTYLGYHLGRSGRMRLQRKAPEMLLDLRSGLNTPKTFAMVAFTRAVPMLSEITTLYCGIVSVPQRAFMLSAAAGTLPFAFLFSSVSFIGSDATFTFMTLLLIAVTPTVIVFGMASRSKTPKDIKDNGL